MVNLLEERGPAYPVIKTGGIASLLGATLNIAEKTKDQNTYESIKCKFQSKNYYTTDLNDFRQVNRSIAARVRSSLHRGLQTDSQISQFAFRRPRTH